MLLPLPPAPFRSFGVPPGSPAQFQEGICAAMGLLSFLKDKPHRPLIPSYSVSPSVHGGLASKNLGRVTQSLGL